MSNRMRKRINEAKKVAPGEVYGPAVENDAINADPSGTAHEIAFCKLTRSPEVIRSMRQFHIFTRHAFFYL